MISAAPNINLEEHLRRSNGRSSRHSVVSVRLTKSEQAELERLAKSERKAMSECCRDVLLAAARGEVVSPVFTELIALRLLLNKSLRGDLKRVEDFDAEVLAIRKNKHKAAAEVMQHYTDQERPR